MLTLQPNTFITTLAHSLVSGELEKRIWKYLIQKFDVDDTRMHATTGIHVYIHPWDIIIIIISLFLSLLL